MQTKAAAEKLLNSKLEYLNNRPLIGNGSNRLDVEWMDYMFKDSDLQDFNLLPLKDKHNLPDKESVLLLYHFFKNINMKLSISEVAAKVFIELKKYWDKSNVPTQCDWWVKKCILDLNSKYQDLLKNLKRDSKNEIEKRENFKSSLKKLFDIASPEAEKKLRKDQVLGKSKAIEDLKFLES